MNGEPVLYDPETDTLLVELRPWPAASPAEVNEQVGGEDAEDGLVVHYGPDGLPHAFESEHASERPHLVVRGFRRSATPRASPRMRDAAAYARCIRRKVGLSQVTFARRIRVRVDTARNWEQGKRAPQGPARALLRVIGRSPPSATLSNHG